MANSISVIAASQTEAGKTQMRNIPSYYCHKIAYGPRVKAAVDAEKLDHSLLGAPLSETPMLLRCALGKRMAEIVVQVMERPRNQVFIDQVRKSGACLRMVADGDITGAVAPSLLDSGIDLYVGIGGSPEGVLTANALRALGGDIQTRMWFRNDAEKADLGAGLSEQEISRVYNAEEIVPGGSAIFCATGVTDSSLLPGVKLIGKTAITYSILLRARSKTVRRIQATHSHGGADPLMIADFINYLRCGQTVGATLRDARMAVATGYCGADSLRCNSTPFDIPE